MAAVPVTNAFFWLITAQLIHALEEYAFELWVVFAPARYLSGLVSENVEFGYILINITIILAGYFCCFKIIATGSNWTNFIILFWLFFETGNGLGHIVLSGLLGYHIPGLFTSPLLLIAAFVLWRSWKIEKSL